MNALTPVTAPAPVVCIVDGEPRADSLDIASFFHKSHRSVLQTIDTVIASEPDLALHEIMQGSYTVPETGQQQHRRFLLTRDAFTLVAMGFTGATALKWKRAYIAAFNEMEEEIRQRRTPAPAQGAAAFMDMMRNPATALELIGHYATANLALQEKVQAAAPAVAFQGALVESRDTWGLQEAGKALGQKPNGFIQWLLGRGDIYRRTRSLCAKHHLVDRGIMTVRWDPYGSTPKPVTQITGKGIVLYARLLGVKPPAVSPQGKLPGF